MQVRKLTHHSVYTGAGTSARLSYFEKHLDGLRRCVILGLLSLNFFLLRPSETAVVL